MSNIYGILGILDTVLSENKGMDVRWQTFLTTSRRGPRVLASLGWASTLRGGDRSTSPPSPTPPKPTHDPEHHEHVFINPLSSFFLLSRTNSQERAGWRWTLPVVIGLHRLPLFFDIIPVIIACNPKCKEFKKLRAVQNK